MRYLHSINDHLSISIFIYHLIFIDLHLCFIYPVHRPQSDRPMAPEAIEAYLAARCPAYEHGGPKASWAS